MKNIFVINLDFLRPQYLCGILVYLLVIFLCGQYELFGGGIFSPHDSFYPITEAFEKSFEIFSIRNGLEGSVLHLFVHIPDLVLISLLKKIIISNLLVQNIHTIICYILFYSVSYFSFSKIFKNDLKAAGLALAYCLSPFAAILYSAGLIYTISMTISLGILPLFIYTIINVYQGKNERGLPEILVLLALGVNYLIPALLVLGVVYLIKLKNHSIRNLVNDFWSQHFFQRHFFNFISVLPFIFFIWISVKIVSPAAYLQGAANDAINGGIFYPLMQISTWAIYKIWHPRAVINFYEYFFTVPYKLLSAVMVVYISLSLYKVKNYFYIALILFFAFLAKGPNPPFGQIYSLILEYLPLGYAIRTPDTKFGAFIIAAFLVSIYYVRPKDKKIIYLITCSFILINLFGMYSHGAISPRLGPGESSYYVYETDESIVAKIINENKNHVVLTNQDLCAGIFYNKKFHTCADIVLANVDRQIIGNSEGDIKFSKILDRYHIFPRLIYINKNKENYRDSEFKSLLNQGFELLYSSQNYALFRGAGLYNPCISSYSFSCVKSEAYYYSSAPKSYMDWHFPALVTEISPQGVRANRDPGIESPKSELLRFLLASTYLLALTAALVKLIRGLKK